MEGWGGGENRKRGWLLLPPEHFTEVPDNLLSADTLTSAQRRQRLRHNASRAIVLPTSSQQDIQQGFKQCSKLPPKLSQRY